ncbi:MAG: hypothetical protein RLZZ06_368 [Actinomycetota bacterium]
MRTIGYLGASSAWSLGYFLFLFYLLSLISFLSDAVRTSNFTPLWFLVSGAAFLPPLAIGLTYRFAFLARRKEKSRPTLNLVVAAAIGASRNLSVGLFADWAGLDNEHLWLFRLVGGASMGIMVFAFWAVGNGSRIEYFTSLRTLSEIQNRLMVTRKLMGEHLSVVNDGLQERTKQALIPQLDSIRQLLGSFDTTKDAVEKLRSTITDQIRPMMVSIANEIPEPFQAKDMSAIKNLSLKLPKRFTLKDKIEVTYSSLIQLLGVAIWMAIFQSPNGVLDFVAMFVIYFIILSIFKLLLPKERMFSRFAGTLTVIIFAMAASAANSIYLHYLNYPIQQYLMLVGFEFISGMFGPLLLLQLGEVRELRHKFEEQMRDDLDEIAKENALFAQKVWVFRKRWLLVLHGNVQSALTAALTRLQNAQRVDAVVVELVKQDLRRAEVAVNSNLNDEINLESGLNELREVWQGICDIDYQISERAKRALARNLDSAFCVNEIVKEAVSNAVRHGEASKASVKIDRIADDLLNVTVTNNGTPVDFESDSAGIGSSMLDEICLDWQLGGDRNQVKLEANLPVKL